MRLWIIIGILAALPFCSVSTDAAPAVKARIIPAGTTVAAALDELRSAGFVILFSDRLVSPDLRLRADLPVDTPRAAADRLLAEHDLQLRSLRPGLFVVVRAPAASAGGNPQPEQPEPLAEVAIYASRYSVDSPVTSAAQLSRTDIETLAGLDEDALRVVHTLPGTASTPLSARTHVRGGSDNEMLVRFDGIPQLSPFHFKDFGAILGSVDPATIDALDFYSGVFPVRYGDRLSAVMDIHPRSARSGNHHEIGLSLLAAHALSVGETTVAGTPTRWLISARSSSAGWLVRAADIEGVEIEFSDLLLRGEQSIGDWTLVAGLSSLQDELDYQNADGSAGREEALAGYRDNMVWLRAWRDTDSKPRFATSFAVLDSRADRRGQRSQSLLASGSVAENRRSRGYYFDVGWQKKGFWSLGAEVLELRSRYDHAIEARFEPRLAGLFNRPDRILRQTVVDASTRSLAVHGSRLISLSDRWRVDLGVRAEQRNRPKSSLKFSPRLAMEYELSDGRFLRASAGRTLQGQRADELQVADGDTSFHPVQKADQWVVGYEQLLADRGAWRIEAYRKQIVDPSPRYENLLDPVSLVPEMEIDRRRLAPDGALAYGVEISGRYALDARWSGFMNYAWSEVEDDLDGIDVPRDWNQQHALLVGLSWRAGSWILSGQGSWRTGWSRTLLSGGDIGVTPVVIGERNRARWPAQWSIDARAVWRQPLSSGSLEIALDVNNLTDQGNPCCTDLRLVDGRLETRTRSWLPRYLNLGVVWSLP